MNQVALPSKGSLQTLLFWLGMYCLALCFAIFIGMSIFYTISKHNDNNRKSTSLQSRGVTHTGWFIAAK